MITGPEMKKKLRDMGITVVTSAVHKQSGEYVVKTTHKKLYVRTVSETKRQITSQVKDAVWSLPGKLEVTSVHGPYHNKDKDYIFHFVVKEVS